MKFKKRILTEEVGLPRSHRKTYTTNKKQKVVISESQLQRLIGIINEKVDAQVVDTAPKFDNRKWSKGFEGTIKNFIKNKNYTGAKSFLDGRINLWNGKVSKAGPKFKKQLIFKVTLAKKLHKKVGEASKAGDGVQTQNFDFKKWSSQFGGTIKNFIKNKNFDGANSFLNGKLAVFKKKSGKAGPEFKKQLGEKIAFVKKMLADVKKANKPVTKPLKEDSWDLPTPTTNDEMFTMDFATSEKPPTSPKRKMCCKHTSTGDITSAVNGRCPKSSTKVPCKGTPPTNSVGLTERGGRGKLDTPKNMKACKAAGGNESLCAKHLRSGTMPPKPSGTPQGQWILGGFFCCAFDRPCCEGSPIDTIRDMFEERDGEGMNKQKGKFDTPKNMKACKAAGGSESLCAKHLGAGTVPPKPTSLGRKKWLLGGLLCCASKLPCCAGSPIDDVMGTFEESRTLKTTNPINESDIKDMKEWFNRVNKSGRGYNPSKI